MSLRSTLRTSVLQGLTAACAAAALVSVAHAQDGFEALDQDNSGGLSLSELQAAGVNISADAFARYDVDGSGELSPDEYAQLAGGQ